MGTIATMSLGKIVGTWIAAFLTLAIFSFLYKDNSLYKFAEYLFVGSSAGYLFANTWKTNFEPNVFTPVGKGLAGLSAGLPPLVILDHLSVIFPALIGLMMIFMLSQNYGWLARYPICILVGYGSGVGIILSIKTDIIPQVNGTLLPLFGVAPILALQNLIVILCVLTGILYFFFSLEHTGLILGTGSRIGIFILMITFGAQFGTTIMGRIQLLVGRIDFLKNDWWPLVLSLFGR